MKKLTLILAAMMLGCTNFFMTDGEIVIVRDGKYTEVKGEVEVKTAKVALGAKGTSDVDEKGIKATGDAAANFAKTVGEIIKPFNLRLEKAGPTPNQVPDGLKALQEAARKQGLDMVKNAVP